MKRLSRRTFVAMLGLLFALSALLSPHQSAASWGRYPGPYTTRATVVCQSANLWDQTNQWKQVILTRGYGYNGMGARRDPNNPGGYIVTNGFYTIYDYQADRWGFMWHACVAITG